MGVLCLVCTFHLFVLQYFGDFFGTRALNVPQWLACIGLGALCLPYGAALNLATGSEESRPVAAAPSRQSSGKFVTEGRAMTQRIRVAKAFGEVDSKKFS